MPRKIIMCIGVGSQYVLEDKVLLNALASILPNKLSSYYMNVITGDMESINDCLIMIDSHSFKTVIADSWTQRKLLSILDNNKVLLFIDRDRERHYNNFLELGITAIDQHTNFYRLTDSPSRVNSNVLYCENFFHSIIDIDNLHLVNKSNIDDSYFCLMNHKRPHRTELVNLLDQRGLLSRGFVTYHEGGMSTLGLQNTEIFADLVGFHFGDADWPDHNLNIYYNRHALELVTETTLDYVFVTEKTMKPILAGTPYLTVGGAGHLANLRNYGFKTCNDLWDEGYDSIEDNTERMIAVVNMLEKLANKPGAMLAAHQHYQQSYQHNLDVLRAYTQDKDQILNNQLQEIIANL